MHFNLFSIVFDRKTLTFGFAFMTIAWPEEDNGGSMFEFIVNFDECWVQSDIIYVNLWANPVN